MRLSSPSTVGCVGSAAANKERSTGQPAATDPATTNLMKSLRFVVISVSISPSHRDRSFFRAHPQPVPTHNRDQRKNKNDAGDGVDLRRNPPPQPSPDFQRQRIVAPDQKKTHRDLIHGQREDQQRSANN